MSDGKNPVAVLGLDVAYIRQVQQLSPERRRMALNLLRKYHNSVLSSDVTGKSSELLKHINDALDNLMKPGGFDAACQRFLSAGAATAGAVDAKKLQQALQQATAYREQLDRVAGEIKKRNDRIGRLEIENALAAGLLKETVERLVAAEKISPDAEKLKSEISALKKQMAETRINLTTAYFAAERELLKSTGQFLGFHMPSDEVFIIGSLTEEDAKALGITKSPCGVKFHYPLFSRIIARTKPRRVSGMYVVTVARDTLWVSSVVCKLEKRLP